MKQLGYKGYIQLAMVAPHAGAWIETTRLSRRARMA